MSDKTDELQNYWAFEKISDTEGKFVCVIEDRTKEFFIERFNIEIEFIQGFKGRVPDMSGIYSLIITDPEKWRR